MALQVTRAYPALAVALVITRAAAAQSLSTEADLTIGATTEAVSAASSQLRVFGDLGAGWRVYGDGTWTTTRGPESDSFGAAYPYEPRPRLMELHVEKTAIAGRRLLGVRAGRYRTPFGMHARSDHGYGGFLRAPLIRYSPYWAVSNNYLETGASVVAGTTWLSAEGSLGTASDQDDYARPGGLNAVARVQASHGPWIAGASHIRSRPSRTWTFASGRAQFTGLDARVMRGGLLLRGEWLWGQPFARARTRGGYVDLLLHRPVLGPVTAVARIERLDYDAGRFSQYPRRYTVGAKIRATHGSLIQINYVHQPRDVTGHAGHTSLDVGLTYTLRLVR